MPIRISKYVSITSPGEGLPVYTPPDPPITLGELFASPTEATVGEPLVSLVTGRTFGSTLALSGPGATGLSIDQDTALISGTPEDPGTVNVTETLPSALNSPRTTLDVISTLGSGVTLRPMPIYAAARAAAGAGGPPCKVLFIGDSNTSGYPMPALDRGKATTVWISEYMSTAALPVTDDFIAGAQGYGTIADFLATDTRLSLGAGWTSIALSGLGGRNVGNPGNADDALFTPVGAWNTVVVEYFNSMGMTVEYGVAGNIVSSVEGSATVKTKTFTTGQAAAVQPFILRRASGNGILNISSNRCYDSAKPGVTLLNAGAQGFQASDFTSVNNSYSPRSRIQSIAAHLTVIELGLNEYRTAVDPAVFTANMQTLITQGKVSGDVVLVVSNPPDDRVRQRWQQYRSAIQALADGNNLSIVDMTAVLGSYENALEMGLVYDGLHPNVAGIQRKAREIIKVLKA